MPENNPPSNANVPLYTKQNIPFPDRRWTRERHQSQQPIAFASRRQEQERRGQVEALKLDGVVIAVIPAFN